MHELSIAMSIADMAQEEAAQRNVQVTAVHLKLGPLSGVVRNALLSAYELASFGTPLEKSRLIIEEVPIVVYCPKCKAERTIASMQMFECPECASPAGEIVHGRELEVVALEVVENDSRTPSGGSPQECTEEK